MPAKKELLTNTQVQVLTTILAESIMKHFSGTEKTRPDQITVYGVPRGGVPVAYLLSQIGFSIGDDPATADVFVDDIIDSGATKDTYMTKHGRAFFGLIDKQQPAVAPHSEFVDKWIVFPWEETGENGIEDNIRRILQYIGEDADRGGLEETPARVAKALGEWFSGYSKDPGEVLKVFEDGAEKYDEMVIVKDIPFYSKCEHHMADIFGTATIAYIPNGKIVGLSKMSRLLDIFARRLQVQERLTNQVADAMKEHLDAKGVGVVIKARHMCMESRGVCQQGHHTITAALRGVMLDQPETRAEFMALANAK